MRVNETYVTLDRIIFASNGGHSSLEALFNADNVITNDKEYLLIKTIEELIYNKEYVKLDKLLNDINNG